MVKQDTLRGESRRSGIDVNATTSLSTGGLGGWEGGIETKQEPPPQQQQQQQQRQM